MKDFFADFVFSTRTLEEEILLPETWRKNLKKAKTETTPQECCIPFQDVVKIIQESYRLYFSVRESMRPYVCLHVCIHVHLQKTKMDFTNNFQDTW